MMEENAQPATAVQHFVPLSSLPLDQIICGDNCEVMRTLPSESIDLVVTSPPYDDLRTYGGHSWDFYGVAWNLKRLLKPGGVIVWVATRPDSPRPIEDYYQTAQAWDVNEAEKAASLELGWTVRYDLPTNVPHTPGMPRPIDVTVVDRAGSPVPDLTGRLIAMRPSDGRLTQEGTISAIPNEPGRYRTLVRVDQPGEWEMRLDANQQSLRFVHAARMQVAR